MKFEGRGSEGEFVAASIVDEFASVMTLYIIGKSGFAAERRGRSMIRDDP